MRPVTARLSILVFSAAIAIFAPSDATAATGLEVGGEFTYGRTLSLTAAGDWEPDTPMVTYAGNISLIVVPFPSFGLEFEGVFYGSRSEIELERGSETLFRNRAGRRRYHDGAGSAGGGIYSRAGGHSGFP